MSQDHLAALIQDEQDGIAEEPQPLQEQSSQASCPKHPFGQSWQRVAWGEGQPQQGCRFCQQTRAVRLPPWKPGRERWGVQDEETSGVNQ